MWKFLLLLLLVILGLFSFGIVKDKVKRDFTRPIPYPSITIAPKVSEQNKSEHPETQSVFVPYWSLKQPTKDERIYDAYLYFGVAPTKSGINFKEAGALGVDSFLSFVPDNKTKLLVLRMIEADTNFAILKDEASQEKVIQETIALAREKQFDGIILDLEVSAIPFDSLIQQINSFTKLFYQKTKSNDLSFAITIYGDVFYRLRPFDVKDLASNADSIMIMAYDLHKAKGNPGPNFPLRGQDIYGYDYEKMTEDFLRVVPAEKITVVFGFFGYDWVVDAKEKALRQGKALTTSEIEAKFIQTCQQKSCSFSRESNAFETEIHYTDREGQKHIIWFEDMESVTAKKAYLKKRGITYFSYWAHSYF